MNWERGRENGSFPVAEYTNRWVRERSPDVKSGRVVKISPRAQLKKIIINFIILCKKDLIQEDLLA